MSVQYAIATSEMNQIMSRLHRLFDFRVTFFDMQENELQYFDMKPLSPFCAALRKNPQMNERCCNCDRHHLAFAKRDRDVHIYHCHSNLIEGIVPLYDRRNIYLGSIVFGQLRDENHEEDGGWSAALKARYHSLPVSTVERARDIGYLLKCVSESIIDRELIRYRNKPWAEKLELYVEEHLHEKISTETLAMEIGRSASFVAHHFAAEFGQTPRQYILKRRMEEAKLILENGSNVQETAARLGFYDAFHFSKTFKRYWNAPPSQFCPR
jgi:AraC-like DNA-binding protein/ligand-binding sensor protein